MSNRNGSNPNESDANSIEVDAAAMAEKAVEQAQVCSDLMTTIQELANAAIEPLRIEIEEHIAEAHAWLSMAEPNQDANEASK